MDNKFKKQSGNSPLFMGEMKALFQTISTSKSYIEGQNNVQL